MTKKKNKNKIMKNNTSWATGLGIGAFIGLIGLNLIGPISRFANAGYNLVEIEPADQVFVVPMFEGGEQRSGRLSSDILAQSVDLKAKRVIVKNRWVRVKQGFIWLPGVREARPEEKVFTASTADIRVEQVVSAATKGGSSFSFTLSYNARIQVQGDNAEAIKVSKRQNAARFIAKTLGSIPRNQVHIEVDVSQKLEQRAINIFNELLAPIAQRYTQLEIGANKNKILSELETKASQRLYQEFGITISNLTYGGTNFPAATQQKIDANALASVKQAISQTKAQTEAQRADTSRLMQSAFGTSNLSGELFIINQELDALEVWVDAMKKGVQTDQITSPAQLIPTNTNTTKTY